MCSATTSVPALTFPGQSEPHEAVYGRLDIPAFLHWLEGTGLFCGETLRVRDAMLVGQADRADWRVLLLLEPSGHQLAVAATFDFHQDNLIPFLKPV